MNQVRFFVVVCAFFSLPAVVLAQFDSPGPASLVTVTDVLPEAAEGTAYSASLQAPTGPSDLRWSLTGGALPAGLDLDARSGALRGAPRNSGDYAFTLQAGDAGSTKALQLWSLSLHVAPPVSAAEALHKRSLLPTVALVQASSVEFACPPATLVSSRTSDGGAVTSERSLNTLQSSCLRLPASANLASLETTAASPAAAARLLDQAAFGPTATDIQHVQQIGQVNYLLEQFDQPRTIYPQFPGDVGPPCDSTETCWGSDWWKAAVTGPDQLRQRVAFALSHIFVTSTNTVGGYAMVPYYNLLLTDAFSNWRTLMQDVTLSPVMGNYLGMVNSGKPSAGQIANENFARENLQLFNLGSVLLNEDATPQTDGQGHPVPSYTQEQVQAFARAFTGWTYWPRWGQVLTEFQPDPADVSVYTKPMVAIESQHDTDGKVLLNGVTLPAGQTAAKDLNDALDNIFQHPNLPPFICRQLIQQLVTSNPSPFYVARVASVFKDNGFGVRGDLKAVVTAILLDSEARIGDIDPTSNGGHLREPLLYLVNVLRALSYTPTDTSDPWGFWAVSWSSAPVGEAPMQAPSVFGYYSPNYLLPGRSQVAPEFGIENVASVSARKVLADQLIYGMMPNMHYSLAANTDLMSRASNPSDLADELSLLFLHSQMPDQMKQIIVNTITPLQNQDDPQQRVRVALNLVLTSSQYKIIH